MKRGAGGRTCPLSKSYIIESNKKFSKFDFFKFLILVRGDHFDISARVPPNLATPRRNTIPHRLAWCRIRTSAVETPPSMVEINRRVGGRSLCVSPKRLETSTRPHGVTSQNANIHPVRTSNFTCDPE